MTICAAVMNWQSIAVVQDTKLSFFGGTISAEGMGWKQREINKQWQIMFSGDISTLTPMLDAVVEAAKETTEKDLRHFARVCAAAYKEERKRIIEDEVLPDYDLSTYAEYLALKISNPQLFDTIGTVIAEAEDNWHLLFCGFDKKHKPHLFVISGRGKIQYCDNQGFAAIGSGAWAAYVALASYPYKKELTHEETIYCLIAAKFASESAEGVGQETFLHIAKPGKTFSSFVATDTIDKIREKWKALPKVPVGVLEVVKQDLDTYEQLLSDTPPKKSAATKSQSDAQTADSVQ